MLMAQNQVENATVLKLPSMRDRTEDNRVDHDIFQVAESLNWYALWVWPQKEFVAQKLLRRKGVRTFVPVRREWRRRNKYTKDKELKTYPVAPRYVFIGLPSPEFAYSLLRMPIVSGVVGLEGFPMRLPNGPMVKMIRRMSRGINAPNVHKFMRTHHEFKVGDVAEVTEGVFEGRKLPVKEIRGHKALVLAELFGAEMEVEIPLEILQAA